MSATSSHPQYIPTVTELRLMQRRLPISPPRRHETVKLMLYRGEKQFQKGHGFADALDNRSPDMLEMVFESRPWKGADDAISWRWVYVGPTDMTLDDELR
jgi:hypothetical protein